MLAKLRPILVCLLTLLGVPAFAATLNVGPGQPYTTIQSAINAAQNGDTVLVAPGTYYENIDFKGKAITVTSSAGPATTIIDGGNAGATVTFQSGELRGSIISNLTIRDGGYVPNGTYDGGGVYVSNAAPTILNNVITANHHHAIQVEFGAALIQGNELSGTIGLGSSFFDGSGVVLSGNASLGFTHSILIGNTIENNLQANSYDGGGIGLWAVEGTVIQNNIIRNNATSGIGGAIVSYNTDAMTIVGNLIYGNQAASVGAIALLPPDYLGVGILASNTVWGNTQTSSSGCFFGDGPSSQICLEGNLVQYTFANNIVVGSGPGTVAVALGTAYNFGVNPLLFDHNDIYNPGGAAYGGDTTDHTGSDGNISADPQLVNPAGQNFQLALGSPAIDAGDNNAPLITATDLAGNPRIQDATGTLCPIIDMGAYEYPGTTSGCGVTETLQSSANPSAYGQSVTFTAQLTSSSATPTGTVQFNDGSNALSIQPISSTGASTYTTSALAIGTHPITAVYQPTGTFPATTASLSQVVTGISTLTQVLCVPPTSIYINGTVQFEVRVSSGSSTPTGSVTLTDNGATLSQTTLNPGGSYTGTYTGLTAGAHTLTATYAPTGNYAPSTGSCTVNVSLTPVTVTLTSSLNPTNLGQSTTFTATLTYPGDPPAALTSGSITFSDGANALQTVTLVPVGSPVTGTSATYTASYTTSSLTAGTHTITAAANLPAAYASGSASLIQTVNTFPTTTTLTCTPTTYTLGAAGYLALTVTSPNGTPTGNITVTDNGATIIPTSTLYNGNTGDILASQVLGLHTVVGTFTPTGAYAPSTGSCTYTVTLRPITVALTSSANPSAFGQSTTFSATITYGGPTQNFAGPGTLTFSDGVNALQTVSVTPTANPVVFTATYTTSTLTGGVHTITATANPPNNTYSSGSASLTQNVTLLPSTASLAVSPTTAQGNAPVTLTATIAGAGPTPPAGNVLFLSGTTPIGTVAVSGSTASLVLSNLPLGTDQLTCVFSGDVNYTAAHCNTVPVTVTTTPTTLTIASSVNPVIGDITPVNYNIHLATAAGPVAGQTVTFSYIPVGTSTPIVLNLTTDANGNALGYAVTATLPIGNDPISVSFAGTSTLGASSASLIQVQQRQNSFITITPSSTTGYQGQIIPVTLHVSLSYINGPGNVTLYDGATVIQSFTDPLGSTSILPLTFSAGTHTLTATYSGDYYTNPGGSNSVTLTIQPSDFTLASTPATLSLVTGHHLTFTVTATAVGAFSDQLQLSVATLPAHATAEIHSPSVTLPVGGQASTTIYLDTDDVIGYLSRTNPTTFLSFRSAAEESAVAILPWLVLIRKRRRYPRILAILLMFLTAAALTTGCSGKYPASTAPGTYTLQITATGATTGTTHTLNIPLTVTE